MTGCELGPTIKLNEPEFLRLWPVSAADFFIAAFDRCNWHLITIDTRSKIRLVNLAVIIAFS